MVRLAHGVRGGWFATFGLLGSLGTLGCGPGVQSLYESNVRFEHCYRLDLDREIAPTHRRACWQEWVTLYAYGQPRDKLEYARRRIRFLDAGETSPPELDLTMAEPASVNAARADGLNMPDVHAPPPSIAPPEPPPASTAALVAATPAPPALPGAACAAECAATYSVCVSPCIGPAPKPPATCQSCNPDYGRCMQRCYE